MRLVTYGDPADYAIGVLTDEGVYDLAGAGAELGLKAPLTARTVFVRGLAAMADLTAAAELANRTVTARSVHDLKLGPAIPYPGKIFCIGLNYRRHAAEIGLDIPSAPVVFSKFSNTLAAHGDPITLPRTSTKVDYEGELAVIIGAAARDLAPDRALDVVFGYATSNDVSARDLQNRTSQWLLGKTLDGFLPIGPHVVTKDEIGDPNRLGIRTWVNGATRQDSNTSDMIFDVPFLISYLSQHVSLGPGDVILTGTPEGVISGMKEPVWLADGDVVEVEIAGVGRLANRFEAEA
jgi:2-keto-4-pentenoate hydratase/2-oxohepta-3-ene-1,7-dioic acid hydratase in catechol pathway